MTNSDKHCELWWDTVLQIADDARLKHVQSSTLMAVAKCAPICAECICNINKLTSKLSNRVYVDHLLEAYNARPHSRGRVMDIFGGPSHG